MRPHLYTERGAGESGVVAERGDATSALVLQELEIVEGSFARREPGEDVGPAPLVLVAVRELDVCVLQGEGVLREFLEAEDDVVLGGLCGGSDISPVGPPLSVGTHRSRSPRGEAGSRRRRTPDRRRSAAHSSPRGLRSRRRGGLSPSWESLLYSSVNPNSSEQLGENNSQAERCSSGFAISPSSQSAHWRGGGGDEHSARRWIIVVWSAIFRFSFLFD